MTNKEEKEEGESLIDDGYSDIKTFAFFVANFGYTKSDYEKLTKREVLFIMKAWENKLVLESQLVANAFYNAYSNANRKKGTKAIPLWRKTKNKKANIKKLKAQFNEVEKMSTDNDWVKLLYEQ